MEFTYANINTLQAQAARETQEGEYAYWAVMKVIHNRNTRWPMKANEQFGYGRIIDGQDLPNVQDVEGVPLSEIVKGSGIDYPVAFAMKLDIHGVQYLFLHMTPPLADVYVVLSGSMPVALEWV